jgi:succinate dehydrogenase/fumarate reductase flavoprotein subunit
LAKALRVGDRNAVTGLIKRFRFLLSRQPNVSQAQHDAVKGYDNRLVGISRLQGKIQAEHQRLQNLLG